MHVCDATNQCPDPDSCIVLKDEDDDSYHCAGSVTFGSSAPETCETMTYLLSTASEGDFEFSKIEFKLRTTAQNGTQVFVDIGESMITLQLDSSGYLIVMMDLLPDQDPFMIRSNHALNDGEWHRVVLEFFPTNKVMLLIDTRFDESVQMPIQSASYPLVISSERTYLILGAMGYVGCLGAMTVGEARVALGEQPGYNAQPQRVWMPFPTTSEQEKCDITKQYGCHSVSGYCENDDPCASINQTCIPLFNSYRCQCPEGESCIQTTTIPETSSTLVCSDQTCINGQCSELNLCECNFGYEGDNCDINTDDCKEQPCFNDAVCVDLVGDFSCQCGPDYRLVK